MYIYVYMYIHQYYMFTNSSSHFHQIFITFPCLIPPNPTSRIQGLMPLGRQLAALESDGRSSAMEPAQLEDSP